ncbi:hypothetical protein [Arcicella rigui]|uniref:Lipoprotein n=1 Tax=Arcicella rigui TaxID=797020 RepID=A0ABU5Q9K6_9BACT|nr:hypothetical protein [Arcicella rigui]MEA5139520.1 hypothetical protein [Arcicella rigui]
MKYLYILLVLFCNACNNENNKLECYQLLLTKLKNEKKYNEVMSTAMINLPNIVNSDSKRKLNDPSYIETTLIDDAVFFNTNRNKCLLLVLQKTSKDLKLDQVLIIQGTYNRNKWEFSYDRLPLVPEVIYSVNKTIKGGKPISNSFEYLSNEGRKFVLTAGVIKSNVCEIDNNYWFGE